MNRSLILVRLLTGVLVVLAAAAPALAQTPAREPSFRRFHERALAGERLQVVFFGASLTWGANASDQATTSYRARVEQEFDRAYPKAPIKYHDAGIGATGSGLGIYRLERDVLARHPDLVFLDFYANDAGSPAAFPTYEAIVRRLVREAKVPVVAVFFPFRSDMARRGPDWRPDRTDGRYRIAEAYRTPIGNAVEYVNDQVNVCHALTAKEVWPFDGAHPGDRGYQLFAAAAWAGYQAGVRDNVVCTVPDQPLFPRTELFMKTARVRLYTLAGRPTAWTIATPTLVGTCYDWAMSRWLDDVVRVTAPAVAPAAATAAGATAGVAPAPPSPRWRFQVNADTVAIFGECTPTSGKFRVYLDGALLEVRERGKPATELSPRWLDGSTHYFQLLAEGLDTGREHTLELEPLFDKPGQELRFESLCVAGGKATVTPAPPVP